MLYHQSTYAYEFKDRRYDVGDKLGYLQTIIEIALKRESYRGYLVELGKSEVITITYMKK